MSAEIVKKRGRPKKSVTESVEVNMPETTTAASRAKSTKATKATTATATATTKVKAAASAKPATPPKPPPVEMPKKAPPATTSPPKTAPKAPAPAQKPESKSSPTTPTAKQAPKPPVTPETSKILSKVRELPQKPISAGKEAFKSANPSTATSTATIKKSSGPSPKPAAASVATPSPQSKLLPTSTPKIPLTSLNSEIVSDVTARAGVRPNVNANKLPPNYKSVARKVTMAVIAAPVAIVMSYILYERFVLGKERKFLVKSGWTPVESESTVKVDT